MKAETYREIPINRCRRAEPQRDERAQGEQAVEPRPDACAICDELHGISNLLSALLSPIRTGNRNTHHREER